MWADRRDVHWVVMWVCNLAGCSVASWGEILVAVMAERLVCLKADVSDNRSVVCWVSRWAGSMAVSTAVVWAAHLVAM